MGSTDINHLVVGIKVLSKYAYENTHYAFIETDKPNIITFSNLTYLSKDGSRGRLNHIPNVIVMSDGYTFNASMDYTDAKLMNTVWHKRLNISQVKEVNRLVKKYGLTYRLIHSKSKIKTNIIYNGTGILPDHTFYYIKIPTNISKIRVLVNASKPISVYVLSGNWSEIIKTYENHQIPMGSLVKNCKSNDFKNHVDFTCILWNPYTVSGEYSLLGVLIDNQGMGNNTINMLFKK
ncbi:hypothetical protein BMS3Bbin15_01424 [archaeon BMS3Bbin15]|nr:hypothetical protein BMS3Bbin15_01424 [archaeon BMS3Bbin15]